MEFAIFKDILIIFALSTFVNLIFTKLKVPTIIGYMLTGVIAGPYVLGLIQAKHEIEIMAEIGVVLLMFTIGLEFSLQQLLKIRKVVFLGGLFQFTLTTVAILGITQFYGLDKKTGMFVGFLVALSSTAIVLKLLQERSELSSNYGRTVLGILIFQDIMLVPLILYTNMMNGDSVNVGQEVILLGVKAIGIILFIFVGSKWGVPLLLKYVVSRKNHELFLMTIFLICMGVAMLTWELGMSLAFGAFLAGLMISGSDYSHNAFGNLVPFKNMFTSFFFVSIGMLLDVGYILDNPTLVFGTLVIVLILKTIIAGGAGFILGHTFRGTVMVGLALSQVGEFSFILAKIGQETNVLPENYFQLFLAVAVLSMSISPFTIAVAKPFANLLLKLPIPKWWQEGLFPLQEFPVPNYSGHLVIIGKDTRAKKLSLLTEKQDIPFISIVFDTNVVKEKQKKGEHVIYGDAINEPILLKAHVDKADTIVVSVGDIIASSAIVERVREINHNATILARAKFINDMEVLYKMGATHVVPEKFETAIELFKQVLKKRLMPQKDISATVRSIRNDFYGLFREKNGNSNHDWFFEEIPNFEINAYRVEEGAEIVNKSLRELSLRRVSGVTLLALKRGETIIEHPDADIVFEVDDCVYLLGKPEQLDIAQELIVAKQKDLQ